MARRKFVLFGLVDGLVPVSMRDGDSEYRRNLVITYFFMLIMVANGSFLATIRLVRGDQFIPYLIYSGCGLGMIMPFIHRATQSLKLASAWMVVVTTFLVLGLGVVGGGLFSTAYLWLGAIVVYCLIMHGLRAAIFLIAFIAVYGVVLLWLPKQGIILPNLENPDRMALTRAIGAPAGLFAIVSMLYGFFEAHRRALGHLSRQREELARQTVELLAAKSKAEDASRSRSDFIATVSHEIRTPMNGILGVAQLLKATRLDESQDKYLDALLRSSEGLLSILGDILDFSKIEAGKLEIRREPFSLDDLCRECVGVFAGNAETKGLRVAYTIQDGLQDGRCGDALRLRQILLNLLGNAVKFTERGLVNLEVTVPPGGMEQVCFSVSDQGIGMSEETIKLLFKPYSQADSTSSRKYGGTGLGLAICHRLSELMGGKISVDSTVGQGSTFRVVLPLEPAVLSKAAQAAPATFVQASVQGKRVLLVEDNAINRMVATKLLERLGVHVGIAMEGAQAVERWRAESYDLIFMDCQMPGMDGYAAAREIRRLEKGRDPSQRIPILALTAHAMEEDRRRCLDAGMDDYLTKPVKVETLRNALDSWVR